MYQMNRSKPPLIIITHNVRGMNQYRKRQRILREFREEDGDILLLQETYLKGEELLKFKKQAQGLVLATAYSSFSRGVATVFRKGLDVEIVMCEVDPEGRYVFVQIKVEGCEMNLMNSYAPSSEGTAFIRARAAQFLVNISGLDVWGGRF